MGNAIDWLVRPEAHGARTTGLATFGTTTARLIGPGNRDIPLSPYRWCDARRCCATPGLYTAETAGAKSTFAVNVGDPQVSNLARTTLSRSDQARSVGAGLSGRPWWIYLRARGVRSRACGMVDMAAPDHGMTGHAHDGPRC